MSCYHPLTAYRNGKHGITFNGFAHRDANELGQVIDLPCGQCIGCRLTRSRHWAIRCVHEAQLHQHNAFLTLTYDDQHLVERYQVGHKRNGEPAFAGNLHYRDWQLFAKRLRKKHGPFRFYMGAEYGEKFRRPHYHACLFGIDFADKKHFKNSPSSFQLYESATLQKLWPYGFSSIGEITFESAAYIARYCINKINGDQAKRHYEAIDLETGEIKNLKPEFNQMSRNGGIGLHWLNKYTADVYPHGKVVRRGGASFNAPRYYDKQYEKQFPTEFEQLKLERITEAHMRRKDNTNRRLQDKETVAKAQAKMLKRTID